MKEILLIEKQLKKDQIVDTVSRMVKDHDSPTVRGMTEIAARWVTTLDTHLFELQQIENKLSGFDINKRGENPYQQEDE